MAGLKAATRQVVISVLETGVVSSPALGRSSPLEQPLECAVWGLAEGGTVCTGKKNCAGALCGPYKLLANVFPLVVQCKVTDEEVVQHCLGQTSAGHQFSSSELITLLGQARHLQVTLSPHCLSVIKHYFLESRRLRQGSEFPQAALKTLHTLAISHSRLALRCTALEEDAVFACFYFEENLVARGSHSVLGLEAWEMRGQDGEEQDRRLRRMQARLKKLVKDRGGEGSEVDLEE